MKTFLSRSFVVLLLTFASLASYAQNQVPIIVDDTFNITAGIEYYINPMVNDYDPDGDPLSYVSINSSTSDIEIRNYGDSSVLFYINYECPAGVHILSYKIRDDFWGRSAIGNIVLNVSSNYLMDSLTINNMNAMFCSKGNHFYDNQGISSFGAPADSFITIFTSSAWIGGLDDDDSLHLAGEIFAINGNDYFPGPVRDTLVQALEQDNHWNRVWKITKDQVAYHNSNYYQAGYMPIEAIANWPAHGDVNLGQAAQLAPFVDINQDGIYDPFVGDYPKFRGDECVFMLFNESRHKHLETKGLPLGVEFQVTAYAYDCPSDTAINNTIFVHYDIINRSSNNYHDVYFSLFTDLDIGYTTDDLVGSDVDRNSYFGYNNRGIDGSVISGHATIAPPAQAITFLNKNMSSFLYSTNLGSLLPMFGGGSLQYYAVQQSKWTDGTPLTYGGTGYNSGGLTCKYAFPGLSDSQNIGTGGITPTDKNWTDSLFGIGFPLDRRGVGSIGPFILNSGDTFSLDMAYIYARDLTDTVSRSVNMLKRYIDQVQWSYDNDTTICGGNFSAIKPKTNSLNPILVYPNPAHQSFTIEYLPTSNQAQYQVYNIAGQSVLQGNLHMEASRSIDVSALSPGLYFISISDAAQQYAKKLILQ